VLVGLRLDAAGVGWWVPAGGGGWGRIPVS